MELMEPSQLSSNEQILQLVLKEDELSWQQIIFELVRSDEMDPWDIDVTSLSSKFMDIIKKLQSLDCRVSGKMVLACALLVRIKTDRLMTDDLSMLDSLIASSEEDEIDMLEDEYRSSYIPMQSTDMPKIYPKSPQPRQRKVSVYDLVTALEQALDVDIRRSERALDSVALEVKVPEKKIDISSAMNHLLYRISTHFNDQDALNFMQLVPSDDKQGKVLTFIPLLHLTNERRININQEQHFGDIAISLLDDTPVEEQQELEV